MTRFYKAFSKCKRSTSIVGFYATITTFPNEAPSNAFISVAKRNVFFLALFFLLSFPFIGHSQNCTINAGLDQTYCSGETITLQGNIGGSYIDGTLTWALSSGPGSATIVNPNSLSTDVTGMTNVGVYTFSLSTDCAIGSTVDYVDITIGSATSVTPTVAAIPACYTPNTPIQLTGVAPAGHTLTWTVSTDSGSQGTFNGSTALSYTGDSPTVQFPTPPNSYCNSTSTTANIRVTSTNTTTGCTRTVTVTENFQFDFGAINAYTDEASCGSCMPLWGTCPQDGTGTWTIVSEPAGSSAAFTDANASETELCNLLSGGTYTVRWTVSGATCTNGSEDLTFISGAGGAIPTSAHVESISFCGEIPSSIVISGNEPQPDETVSWVQLSGPGVNIVNPNSQSTQLTGLTSAGAPYIFIYRIHSADGCISHDTMQVYSKPGLSINSASRACPVWNDSYEDIEMTPAIWSEVLDSMTVSVTYLSGPMSELSFQVHFQQKVNGSGFLSTPNHCLGQYSVGQSASQAFGPEDIWTSNANLQYTLPELIVSAYGACGTAPSCNFLFPGLYRFEISIFDGCETYSGILEFTHETLISTTAGTDQLLPCGQNSTSLAGVTNWPSNDFDCSKPLSWHTITMPTGATDPINASNIYDLNAPLSGLIDGTYEFALYPNYAICSADIDTVKVMVANVAPIAPAINGTPAGTVCYGVPVALEGVLNADAGSGTWSIVSTSPAGGTGTFTPSASSPNINFYPDNANTAYTLRWTVTNGCGSAFTDITVTTNGSTTTLPSISNADDCDADSGGGAIFGTLSANVAGGTWTSSNSNYTLDTPASQTTTVTPGNYVNGVVSGGDVVFYYTISNACGTFQDSVSFLGERNIPVDPPGGNFCDISTFPFTQTFETPDNSSYETGASYFVEVVGPGLPYSTPYIVNRTSGFPSLSYSITFSEPGTYSYRLVKTSQVCDIPSAWATIQISSSGPLAVAGSDINICGATTSSTLSAQPDPIPADASGQWSVDEVYVGEPPTISDSSDPNATVTFSGNGSGDVLLRWTMYGPNPDCDQSTYDLVRVTYTAQAQAGPDDDLCFELPATTGIYMLSANQVPDGMGTWSIVSEPAGSSAYFDDPSSNETSIIDLIAGAYTLRWSVAGSGCPASSDDMFLTVSDPPQGSCTVSGPNSSANTNENQCGGTETSTGAQSTAWTSLGNTAANDNAYTTITLSESASPSQNLDINSMGWNIPPGSTITGIQASIIRREGGTSGQKSVRDYTIQLLDNGSPIGSNYANTGTNWPTSEATATYGGTTDMWGYTWTDANINDLGIRIAVNVSGGGNPNNTEVANVEQVCITIYYTSLPIYCDTDAGMVFTTAGATGATSYIWTLPEGASISSGDGTNSITVNFNNSGLSGQYQVCATPSNDCSTGLPCCQDIVIQDCIAPCPSITSLSLSTASICGGGNFDATIGHTANPGDLALYYSLNGSLTASQLYDFANHGTNGINLLSTPIVPTAATTSTVASGLNIPTGGSYTVYAILKDGNANISDPSCLPMVTATIGIGAPPASSASNDGPLTCAQSSVTLTALPASGVTYAWSGGGSGQTKTINSTGVYTVTVTDNSTGCIATATTTVTEDVTAPSASASNDGPLTCTQTSVTLTALPASGVTYAWSGGGSGQTETVSSAGVYTVTITNNSNGCTDEATTTVTEDITAPTANAGSDVTICAGESTTLTASGGISGYVWDNGLGAGASHTVSPASTTTYTVTVTAANGCTDTDQVTVTVNALPTANAGSDATICAGESTTLTASGGASYTWDNGLGAGASHAVSPVSTTTYTVTVTAANGCTDTDQVTITVNPSPTANAGSDVSICAGESTTLTASGGTSYTWDNGLGAGASHTVSPSSTTTYTVTVTAANGCTDTDQVTVTVNALPTANAGSDATICAGESTTLAASGGTSYTWDNGLGAGVSHTVSPVSTTTYTVTVTAANGCTDTDQVTVTVNALPTANAGSDATICAGESTTLTASGGASYTWDNGLGAGASHTVSPASTTTYTVTVTAANGCTDTDQMTVTVNALPTANAGSDVTICVGASTNLTASGGTSYTWDNGLGAGASHTVSPASTTTYTVTLTAANGCTDTDQVTVTVDALPTANAGSDATICAGESTTLTASGGVSYTWDNGLGAGASHTVSPASTTTYTVTVTAAGGCTDTDQVTITVNPAPTANAGSGATICVGASTTLTASGGPSYAWDNGLGAGASHTVSPASTTTYTVTVTAANGCTDTDQVTVTVDALPTANAGADATICAGESTTLTASGGASYTWDNGLGAGSSHTVSPVSTTTYTVTVTAAGGCTDTDQVTITVNPSPTADAGSSATICAGESTTLTASGGTSYTWDNGLGAGASHTVSPASTTTYTVSVTAANGCIDTDQVTVTVNALPTANAGSDATICAGESTTLTASGGTSYTWDNGLGAGASHMVSPATTTTYTVTVTAANGCTDTDQMTVTVNPGPTANAGSDATICAGESTTLTASGGTSYTWDNGLGAGASHTVSPASTTTYTVTVTAANGCTDTDQMTVTVNPLPSADAGSDVTICLGSTTALTASGGTSYVWDNGLGAGASHTVSPASTTTYAVTVTSADGCTDIDQVTVTVLADALPMANAGPDTTICPGATTILTASGGVSYAWDNGLGAGASHAVNPASATTYTVTVTGANGCTATDQVIVSMASVPTLTVSSITICKNASIDLTTLVTANVPAGTLTFHLTNADAMAGLNPVGSTVSPPGAISYYVRSTLGDCYDIEVIMISLYPTGCGNISVSGPN